MNFADESACLMASTIRKEVVAIHTSQEMFGNADPLHI
jgi:hypothetical protein